jgi:hypothetical protein
VRRKCQDNFPELLHDDQNIPQALGEDEKFYIEKKHLINNAKKKRFTKSSKVSIPRSFEVEKI